MTHDRYRRPDQRDDRGGGYGWQARGEMSQGRGHMIGDNRWNGAGGYSDSTVVRRDEVYGGRTDSDGAITSARGKRDGAAMPSETSARQRTPASQSRAGGAPPPQNRRSR